MQLPLFGSAALGNCPERAAPPAVCDAACSSFVETNHTLRGTFLAYWLANGGLPIFGYPLTEEPREMSASDGREYVVQWFERARFEYHPEYAGTAYVVLLGQLGRETLAARPDVATLPQVASPAGPATTPGAGRTIVLDPGHERATGGALGVEYREALALAIAPLLEACGYIVRLTRPDADTSLVRDPALLPADPARYDAGYLAGYTHASRILALRPDLAIAIRYNALAEGSGGGSETFSTSDIGGPQGLRLATPLQAEIGTALAERGYTPPYSRVGEDGGIGKTYGRLAALGNVNDPTRRAIGNRLVGLPIVLTEALFETNPTERALITDDATIARLAAGYVRAVDACFGVAR